MNIQLLNKIAAVGLKELGNNYNVGETVENPDGIMVRSAVMHEMEFGSARRCWRHRMGKYPDRGRCQAG